MRFPLHSSSLLTFYGFFNIHCDKKEGLLFCHSLFYPHLFVNLEQFKNFDPYFREFVFNPSLLFNELCLNMTLGKMNKVNAEQFSYLGWGYQKKNQMVGGLRTLFPPNDLGTDFLKCKCKTL